MFDCKNRHRMSLLQAWDLCLDQDCKHAEGNANGGGPSHLTEAIYSNLQPGDGYLRKPHMRFDGATKSEKQQWYGNLTIRTIESNLLHTSLVYAGCVCLQLRPKRPKQILQSVSKFTDPVYKQKKRLCAVPDAIHNSAHLREKSADTIR